MKHKIYILLSLVFVALMNSCALDPDSTASKMMGKWEAIHIEESEWYYYLNEDGSKGDVHSYEGSHAIEPYSEEWLILNISALAISVVETGDEESAGLCNIPFPYSLKGDKLSSLLLSYDYTNTVTISFKDDDTMIFYVDDSGEMENGGYDHYESWLTFCRVK